MDVPKASDPRARRTREGIDRAFVELLHRRSYDSIRVGDVTKKARVGRATFYAHYESKHALLRSQLDRIVVAMVVATPDSEGLFDCTRLFAHIRAYPRLFRVVLTGEGARVSSRIVQDAFEARFDRLLAELDERHRPRIDLPRPIVTRFVAASLLALVGWWVENEVRETPEFMQHTFLTLTGAGITEGGVETTRRVDFSAGRSM
jgi:AcrR family transcriptional regulator